MLVFLDGIDPSGPSTAHFRIGPAAIRFQNPTESEDPRRNLNVDEGDTWSQKEGTVDMRRIDQFCDFIPQLFGIGDLLLRILFLQDAIKAGDDMAVDLFSPVSYHATCCKPRFD